MQKNGESDSPEFLRREFSEAEWKSWFEQSFERLKAVGNESPSQLLVGGDIEASFCEELSDKCHRFRPERNDPPKIRELKHRAVARIASEVIERNLEVDFGSNSRAILGVEYLSNGLALLQAIGRGVLDRGTNSLEKNIMRAAEILSDATDDPSRLNFIFEALGCLRSAPGLTIDGYKLGSANDRSITKG
ncbi:MAG: hypothetical protein U0930_26645 [Pirellulales bacterium]